MVEARQALVGEGGDITRASHPLDLALARGWLTERQHRAGMRFASLYRRARLGAPDGDGTGLLKPMREPEAESGTRYSAMSDEAITEAFDRVFGLEEGPDEESEAAEAGLAWRRLNAALTPSEQAELFLVCVRASWPQWIIQRAAGHFGTRWEDRRVLLVRGLDAIIGAGARRAPRPAHRWTAAPPPAKPAPSYGPEERTAYVTPDGALLFEVVRKGRRGGVPGRSQNPVSRKPADAL